MYDVCTLYNCMEAVCHHLHWTDQVESTNVHGSIFFLVTTGAHLLQLRKYLWKYSCSSDLVLFSNRLDVNWKCAAAFIQISQIGLIVIIIIHCSEGSLSSWWQKPAWLSDCPQLADWPPQLSPSLPCFALPWLPCLALPWLALPADCFQAMLSPTFDIGSLPFYLIEA